MKGQELKIIFKEAYAFLTDEVALDFNQVQISEQPARFKAPAFWTVRVINHIEKENRLFVEVLAYEVGETGFSDEQVELADILVTIEKVNFKSIDTTGLLRTLNSTAPLRMSAPKPETVYRRETPVEPETKMVREPVKQSFTETFSVPFKNVTFLLGGVTFDKKLPAFNKQVRFEIVNENIIEEYDAIKNYFSNILKTKKIQVIATIETEDGEITEQKATSVEIDKIDATMIDQVKFEVVKNMQRRESKEDKQLFTIDQYLETFNEDAADMQSIFKDELGFFETLLKMPGTKHYRHLRFLSSKHRHDLLKLRFIHSPFSFVFLLSGADKFFIIWETLDTQEATYIWTIDSDTTVLNQELEQVDKTIKLIKTEGKSDYISRNEENFYRVFHDYTDLENGFKNWKSELEKFVQ